LRIELLIDTVGCHSQKWLNAYTRHFESRDVIVRCHYYSECSEFDSRPEKPDHTFRRHYRRIPGFYSNILGNWAFYNIAIFWDVCGTITASYSAERTWLFL